MEAIRVKPEREEQMLAELAAMAGRHVMASSGRLELLPSDPDSYPAQRAYHIEGDPQPAAVIESVAAIAESRFPELQQKVDEAESRSQEISRLGELLKAGNNVILATNHGDLIDIALAEAAIYCKLDKQGYKANSGIIISKMVAMLGYKLGKDAAPAAEVLKILCNDIFLSFPRTETIKKSRLGRFLPDDIKRHNDHMVEVVTEKLAEGGQLLAIAPSGTVDKPDQSYPDTIRLGHVGHGTAKLMTQPKTFALPIAVWLNGHAPVFELADIPRCLHDSNEENEAGVHDLMQNLAKTLTRQVEGKAFSYADHHSVGSMAVKSSL